MSSKLLFCLRRYSVVPSLRPWSRAHAAWKQTPGITLTDDQKTTVQEVPLPPPPPPPLQGQPGHNAGLGSVLPPPAPQRADVHKVTSIPIASAEPFSQKERVTTPPPPPPPSSLPLDLASPPEQAALTSISVASAEPFSQKKRVTSPPPPPPPPSSLPLDLASPPEQAALTSISVASAEPFSQKERVTSPPPPPPPPPSLPMDLASPPEQGVAGLELGLDSVPSTELGPDEILLAIERQGAKHVLSSCWQRIEELQKEKRFTLDHISLMFDLGSRQPAMATDPNHRYQMLNGEVILPVGTRIVQLFSNFVCEKIVDLTPDQITIFVNALTSHSFSQDEFWLFMLAKRVQDTPGSFTPEQIIAIADRYANKNLEDDEFFNALSQNVASRLTEFSVSQLSSFLYSCARLRFLDEELCKATVPLFENPACLAKQSVQTLATALTACSLLDLRFFQPMACCRQLVAHANLRALIDKLDILVGSMLSMVYLRNHNVLQFLLPALILEVGRSRYITTRHRASPHELALVHRRVTLVALCAAFGMPDVKHWSLSTMKSLADLHEQLSLKLEKRRLKLKSFDPTSSSFHLEVVAVLQLIELDHSLEHPQHPFHLDVFVSPAQMEAALDKWNGLKPKAATIAWPPAHTGSEATWPPA